MTEIHTIKQLDERRKRVTAELAKYKKEVIVCAGTGCLAAKGQKVMAAFRRELKRRKLDDKVRVTPTGCHGFCQQGPIVVINPKSIFYCHVLETHVKEIIERSVVGDGVVEDLLYRDPKTRKPIVNYHDVPFYSQQYRLVLGENGVIDPADIDAYIAKGGYRALLKAVRSMTPERVIREVTASGLRGRGGAGFPAGLKWELTRKASGEKKYMICNADEGDPGAFMDRSILEGNPHSVIEGIIIAAHAIGCQKAYVYVRAEYPLAIAHLRQALTEAKQTGFLGTGIAGRDFAFDIVIKEGAGAFVCGEETALMESIEGRRGMPRVKPPYPAESGLWGCPTCINNVETFANVRHIINNGAQWYSAIGSDEGNGTKVFSLTGKVRNSGLIEVPIGMTLREIVFDIGGGVPRNHKFKAVQIGGPSGGMLPASLLDIKIDYRSLTEAGAMMGSGGLVVLDDRTCAVDMARYFLEFTVSESCGKCVPCRMGTKRLLEILERIVAGYGEKADIKRLHELSLSIIGSSLCGLGQSAPKPVLTTLRYFGDEYLAHVVEKRCPAAVCVALTRFEVVPELCRTCGRCLKVCPTSAISEGRDKPALISKRLCTKCRACIEECPFSAIR